MNRFLTVTFLAFVLAALVGAQGNSPRPSPADQARMLERNKELLKVTIERGLDLSASDGGPLDRAQVCTNLAGEWSVAIQQAASAKDAARVQELGGHFGKVVDKGVVSNLQQARAQTRSGSQAELLLLQRRDEALDILKVLEDALGAAREYEPVMRAVHERLDTVNQAAKLK